MTIVMVLQAHIGSHFRGANLAWLIFQSCLAQMGPSRDSLIMRTLNALDILTGYPGALHIAQHISEMLVLSVP